MSTQSPPSPAAPLLPCGQWCPPLAVNPPAPAVNPPCPRRQPPLPPTSNPPFPFPMQAMGKVTNSLKLEDVNAATFDAVFLPGGHGACFDLPESAELQKQLSAAYVAGKVVAAVW